MLNILHDLPASTAHGQVPDSGPFPGILKAMWLFDALPSRCNWQHMLLASCKGGFRPVKLSKRSATPQHLCSMGCPPDCAAMDRVAAQPGRVACRQSAGAGNPRRMAAHCTGMHRSVQLSRLWAAGVRVEVQGAARLLLDTPSGHALAVTPTTVACHPLHGGPPQVQLSCSCYLGPPVPEARLAGD